jgi:hypothetical protein
MDRSTPGYWFLAAESEFNGLYTTQATPLAGDLTYWYESYDNIDLNYNNESKMVDVVNFEGSKSLDIYSTPSFIASYYDEQLIIPTGSTPIWTPPKWVPIPKYEKYQAGLLKPFPYEIED